MSHHDDRHWFNLAKTVGFCCILSLIGACASTPAHAASKKVKTDQGVITMSNRVIDFIGPVHFRMIKRAQKQFMMFNAQSNEPIWIRINSPGGSVGAGLVEIRCNRMHIQKIITQHIIEILETTSNEICFLRADFTCAENPVL